MNEQVQMFHGYEVQADYLDIPGVSGKLPVRQFVPADVEPEPGDVMELTIKFKLGLENKIGFGNDGNRKGEVADHWVAVPISDEIQLSAYMGRAEWDRIWAERHGAVAG